MPFKSQAQAKAAFSGALGPEMQQKAPEFGAKTDFNNLPAKATPETGAKRRVFRRKPKAAMPSHRQPKI